MAESDLLVTISGAALSLLFFENVRSVSDQMGFLLGEALEFVIRTYTDSDNQVETVKTHINVETIVTCSLPDILHDSSSRINKEHLKDFIRDKSKQVIGWFHFRRSTNNLVPSMKDKLLHKQFAAHFSSGNGCKEEFFLTCLLSASTSEMRGTHKFRHVFLRRKREMFEPIPLRINNLGDDASRHDGSDYKPMPIRKSKCIPDGFTKLIESLNLDFTKTGGLDSAMEIQRVAERHLNSLIPKMCESDLEVADLERQVRELRVKIAAQQLIRKSKINGENCIKEIKENSLSSEVIETPWKNETNKIDDNASCLQNEHLSTSYIPQSVSSQRTACRNTAACIVKSVSQDRSRRLGLGSDVQEQQFHASADIVSGTNRHRRLGSISDITDEPINSEGNEVYTSSTRGKGRGRGNGNGNGNGSGSGSGSSSGSGSGSSSGTGSGSGVSVNRDRAHEFNIGVRKTRRVPSGAAHPSTRNVTPEQDFSDAAGTPHSPTISRSYNQASKKSLDGPRNTTGSLNI